jgi:YHS domain-containing protein
MRSPRWPAWFILPATSDRARVSCATFTIVLLVCFMRSPPVSSATVPVSGPKDSPAVAALKQSGRYESLRSAFREAQHQVEPQGAGFRLENPENQLQAEFHNDALSVQHPKGRFGLRLAAYGYGERLQTPAPASIHATGTRIEYRRGPLTEWYVNAPQGLEQGFTLRERPEHPQRGPLKIELAFSGGLRPALVGEYIELRRGGRAVLRYTDLQAWDAAGRVLAARMVAHSGRIRLEVTDRGALYPVTVDPWIQQQELTAADGANDDVFGYSVAVSGNTAIIGAAGKTVGNNTGQGAAYVFTCSGTPCTWTQQQELTSSDGARDDEFGNTVAVSGNTAIIGAWGKNSLYLPEAPETAVAPQGAAYVFTCSGTPCTWTQQQELTASDGASGDEFGNTVAVSGNTAIIGAPYKNSYRGAAYVFTCSGTPCTWTQRQELTASDGANGDVFGYSVAVSGETAIIGAIGNNSSRGGAYVFTCSGTLCTWTQQQELTASDAAGGDVFGTRVAVSGATAVIGAPGKTIGNNSLQGAAYVFTCSGIPCTWTQQQELTASNGASGDEFGNRADVSGNTVIIGNNSSQGAAYVFTCSGSPCTWKVRRWWPFRSRKQPQQALTGADVAPGDEFGYSVAVSGSTVIIGAAYKNSYQGAAYVFDSSAIAITGPPTPPPP